MSAAKTFQLHFRRPDRSRYLVDVDCEGSEFTGGFQLFGPGADRWARARLTTSYQLGRYSHSSTQFRSCEGSEYTLEVRLEKHSRGLFYLIFEHENGLEDTQEVQCNFIQPSLAEKIVGHWKEVAE